MNPRTAVNWEDLRAYLERSRQTISRTLEPGPEEVQAILRRRAARLARRMEEAREPGTPALLFDLLEEHYALELSYLAQVLPHATCAPVPGAPPQLAGVLQVRGEIRPVWDLYRTLGLRQPEAAAPQDVLVVRAGGREFGLRVGAVREIRSLEPPAEIPARRPHVKWITPDLITVLNPEGLFEES